MAHFAKLDKNGTVIEVVVISNSVVNDLSFPDSEPLGIEFCKSIYGQDTDWMQTSYNGSFRYNYAGNGHVFYAEAQPHGAFIAPKPYPSWSLNTAVYQWEAPVPYPNDGEVYKWDEQTQSWVIADQSLWGKMDPGASTVNDSINTLYSESTNSLGVVDAANGGAI